MISAKPLAKFAVLAGVVVTLPVFVIVSTLLLLAVPASFAKTFTTAPLACARYSGALLNSLIALATNKAVAALFPVWRIFSSIIGTPDTVSAAIALSTPPAKLTTEPIVKLPVTDVLSASPLNAEPAVTAVIVTTLPAATAVKSGLPTKELIDAAINAAVLALLPLCCTALFIMGSVPARTKRIRSAAVLMPPVTAKLAVALVPPAVPPVIVNDVLARASTNSKCRVPL